MNRLAWLAVVCPTLLLGCTGKKPLPPCSKPPCVFVRLDTFSHDADGKNIVVSNDTMVYNLTCDSKQSSCITPLADTYYEYIDSGDKLDTLKSFIGEYPKGDTVALMPTQGKVGIYVLWEAHRKKKGAERPYFGGFKGGSARSSELTARIV